MGDELHKIKELWRTGNITDAQYVELSNKLAHGVQDRNCATLKSVRGQYIIISYTKGTPTSGEDITIVRGDSTKLTGEVVEVVRKSAGVQVFEGTSGIDSRASFELAGGAKQLIVSEEYLGRAFNGTGKPIDRGNPVSSGKSFDIKGNVINPVCRVCPSEIVHTGISAIDLFCPLYRGSTLPIFSVQGLPHDELACQVACNFKFSSGSENTVIIISTMGAHPNTVRMYREKLQQAGLSYRTIILAGTESQPLLESTRIPLNALTVAEYFAVERELNVLLICSGFERHYEACVTLATGRDQLLPRKAPIWYYSELAKIFERAGRFAGSKGSITHIPIVKMQDDDVTHCTPDTIGSLTDGHIFLSRSLHDINVYPPIDVLQSSSRFFSPSI